MDIRKSFLQQSYNDNWDIYQKTLDKGSYVPKWDIFIVTASNEEQANAYRLQIDYRIKNGYLPQDTKFLVIPDPEGKRVGSGGATLNAIYETYSILKTESAEENAFINKKILIIHSGGDSKRIPQYSAFGKLFSKVPRKLPDGRYSTLFDEFVISLSGLPSRMKDGLVIASGDVLLLFNHNQIDLGRQGAVGISIKSAADTGTHHGVYVSGESSRVKKFLHKQTLEKLSSEGAVNDKGYVNIDTGLIWMDSDIIYKLLGLLLSGGVLDNKKYGEFVNDKLRLNFYGDFLIPLTDDASLDGYLKEDSEGIYCEELLEIRKKLWETLQPYNMFVQALSPAEFIHFGTTAEFRDLMKSIDNEYRYLSWQSKVISYHEGKAHDKNIVLFNSFLDSNVQYRSGALLEDSFIRGRAFIGEGSVCSNIYYIGDGFTLKDNLVLHQLPTKNEDGRRGYITRLYGVYDNPKYSVENGKATFLNMNIKEFILNMGIDENDIWNRDDEKSLWNARIYPCLEDRYESLKYALMLQYNGDINDEDKAKWLESRRYSLKESYEMADQKAILRQQDDIEDEIRAACFIQDVINGVWLKEAVKHLGSSPELIEKRLEIIINKIDEYDDFTKIRLYRAAAEVIRYYPNLSNYSYKKTGWRGFEDIAYSKLNGAILKSMVNRTEFDNGICAIDDCMAFKAREAVVEMPARVNFGGGWSDTPPYSIENGGIVLNAAISLKGEMPIRVYGRALDEYIIRFESRDLNIEKTFTEIKQVLDYSNPSDPFALHKASLVAAGVIPAWGNADNNVSLKDILSRLGGGISITTEVDIPKGSGLGTSSILAGAALKCIYELLGKGASNQELFNRVLCLEQLMTTGGGWQDQVGGLVPGIKLVSSSPGLPQKIEYAALKLDTGTVQELRDRFAVVYTGQRRLAKGILREIMGEYMLNNPVKVKCLSDIQKIALMMKFELEKGNVDGFAELMNEHWKVNKLLDSGCTNTYIDGILKICEPFISGAKICGAGGGGFLQVVLKDKDCRGELNNMLHDTFQDDYVGIWDTDFIF